MNIYFPPTHNSKIKEALLLLPSHTQLSIPQRLQWDASLVNAHLFWNTPFLLLNHTVSLSSALFHPSWVLILTLQFAGMASHSPCKLLIQGSMRNTLLGSERREKGKKILLVFAVLLRLQKQDKALLYQRRKRRTPAELQGHLRSAAVAHLSLSTCCTLQIRSCSQSGTCDGRLHHLFHWDNGDRERKGHWASLTVTNRQKGLAALFAGWKQCYGETTCFIQQNHSQKGLQRCLAFSMSWYNPTLSRESHLLC